MTQWYLDQYASNPSAENPFGSELLAERSNSALLEYLNRGGSIINFPRASRRTQAEILASIDRAIENLPAHRDLTGRAPALALDPAATNWSQMA